MTVPPIPGRFSARKKITPLNHPFLFTCLLAGSMTLQLGCKETVEGPDPQSIQKQSSRDNFNEALQYISSLDDFDQQQVVDLTVYYLNRWIAPKSSDDQWNRSSLIDNLPGRLKTIRFVKAVGETQFSYLDVEHIHQCRWLRNISDWVNRNTDAPHLQAWNETLPEKLDTQQREKLLVATRLFDWTIRNLQLDRFEGFSQEELDRSWNLAFEATPGPGYTMFPRENLLFGHGDAWQRARVFMLLARQQRIDTVMLAIQRTPDGQPYPWLPAIILNDEMYLFDTELGLPILARESRKFVSLRQLRENPAILTDLFKNYRIKENDLDQVTALIDASPFAMSQRMLMLQKQLTGEHRMILSVRPDQLGKQLRDKHAITSPRLWNIPFEVHLYQEGLQTARQSADTFQPPWTDDYPMQAELFRPDLRSPLVTARQRYVRGHFENRTESKGQSATLGAKPLLMAGRRSENEIKGILEVPELQETLQLQRQPEESSQAWQERLKQAQRYYRVLKQYASYWIGIIQLEEGQYEVAVGWLEQAITDGPEHPFFQGAHYNLGRCYEALGQRDKAMKMYAFADSAQQAGNLLRAELLLSPAQEK